MAALLVQRAAVRAVGVSENSGTRPTPSAVSFEMEAGAALIRQQWFAARALLQRQSEMMIADDGPATSGWGQRS
jgi:hypothetical protein